MSTQKISTLNQAGRYLTNDGQVDFWAVLPSDVLKLNTSNPTATGTLTAPQIASPVQTLTPTGTTQTINLNLGSVVYLNLASATGNVTLTIQNATAGATYLITVIQGATARTLIFPTGTRQTVALTSNNVVANSRFKIAMDFDGTNFDASINLNLFV